MVSITGKLALTGAHGITTYTDQLFEETDYTNAAFLVLPGANNLNAHEGLRKELKSFYEKGEKVAAICAAPLVLGGLQILDGKRASCYPGFKEKLLGAKLSAELAVKSGNVITSRGPGTELNFALEIVTELKGRDVANELANGMLVQTR